jgi:sec-independent protein translocase protein TatB
MDILGIGPAELILILLVIILVIGPKDIGKTARSIGRFLNRLYKSDEWRTVTEASRTIRTLPNRLAREAELEELKEIKDTFDDAKKDLVEAKDDLEESTKEIKETQKELKQDVQSIDDGMKSWTTPTSSEETTIEEKPLPEPEANSIEQKQTDQISNDE